jgi:hypothetical protein
MKNGCEKHGWMKEDEEWMRSTWMDKVRMRKAWMEEEWTRKAQLDGGWM